MLVVTGSESFIGSALRRQARALGLEWFGVDLAPGADLVADIAGEEWIERLPEAAGAIVHLAAVSRDADCRRDPVRAVAVNLTGTLRVIEAAQRRSIRQIIFASSEWVYGDVDSGLKNEDHPIDAGTLAGEYAVTKLAGERLLEIAAARAPGLAATVLRFGIVYGPRKSNWSAVESLDDAVRRLDRIEVGSLAAARRFVHVSDVARGIVCALGRPGYEVFNLTGDSLITLGEVIAESARQRGRAPQVTEKNPGAPSIRNIDNARARDVLRWRPEYDLRRGLESLR